MIRIRVVEKHDNGDGTVTLHRVREYRSGLSPDWIEVKGSHRIIVRDKATGRVLSEEKPA